MLFPSVERDHLVPITAVLNKPELLDMPDCPYDRGTKKILKKFIDANKKAAKWENYQSEVRARGGEENFEASLFADENVDKLDVIEREIALLSYDLKQYGRALNDGEAEKLQYFKTQTNLLEKLINLRERVYNLKQMSQFMETIMALLEEEATDQQKAIFLKRLEEFKG